MSAGAHPRPVATGGPWWWWGLLAAILLALRLIHLGADPPTGLTWSTAILTDEGYYGSGAVRWLTSGAMHLPGDWNPFVAAPVMNALEAATMRIVGLGLVGARLPGVLLFGGLVFVLGLTLARRVGGWTGAAVVAVVGLQALFFADSRLALLDLPMVAFMVLALVVLARALDRERLALGWLGGALIAVSLLTKALALAVLSGCLVLVWFHPAPLHFRRRLLAGAAAGAAVVLFSYAWYAGLLVGPRVEDARYFFLINAAASGAPLVARARDLAVSVVRLDPAIVAAAVLAALHLPVVWGERRRHPLLPALWATGAALGGQLLVKHYFPTRYLLPPLLLMAVAALWTAALLHRRGARVRAGAIALLCLTSAGVGLVRDLGFLANARYDLRDAALDIARRAGAGAVLYGRPTLQLSLINGLPAVTEEMGVLPRSERIAAYRPTHYVQLGPAPEASRRELAVLGELELVVRYDFVGRYGYPGLDALYFYRIAGAGPAGDDTDHSMKRSR